MSGHLSYLFGKILFITFRGMVQATVIFSVAVLFGTFFASIAITIALAVDDHDGYF